VDQQALHDAIEGADVGGQLGDAGGVAPGI
jgi:hypothetical protein